MRKNHVRGGDVAASVAALLALTVGLAPLSPAEAQDESHVVQAGRLAEGEQITVDGRLDDPAWQHAGVIEDLTQQSPHPGEPTPYHTKVLLLRDGHTLYIGLVCDDPNI